LEFAGIFNGLKSEVHVFIRQKKVLRGFDEEVGNHEQYKVLRHYFVLILSLHSNCELCLQIRDFVEEHMALRGIEFHTEESPVAITKAADGSLSLKTSKGTVEGFSHIMFATGRKPNTKV
jgi:glutathione reductase (NADPH)